MPGAREAALAAAVCRAFNLGAPTAALARAPGGLSNHVWRLTTDRGRFAVKELHRDPRNSAYADNVERAASVERLAYAAGTPMPRPLLVPGSERVIAELPGIDAAPISVRVHDWVDARALTPDDDPIVLGYAVGAALGRLHALAPLGERLGAGLMDTPSLQDWRDLAGRAAVARLPLAERLRSALGSIARAEAVVEAARSMSWRVVLTHRDLDQKNTLLDADGGLLLIDWDAAGPAPAWLELAAVALDWSGVHDGEPNETVVETLIEAYRAAGGALGPAVPEAFAYFLCVCLDWLAYNVRRCLGEALSGPEDALLAERVASGLLANLPRWVASLDRWRGLLG